MQNHKLVIVHHIKPHSSGHVHHPHPWLCKIFKVTTRCPKPPQNVYYLLNVQKCILGVLILRSTSTSLWRDFVQ